jgi:hypothetical protein
LIFSYPYILIEIQVSTSRRYNLIPLFSSLLSALEDSPHQSSSLLLPRDEDVEVGGEDVTSEELGNVVPSE